MYFTVDINILVFHSEKIPMIYNNTNNCSVFLKLKFCVIFKLSRAILSDRNKQPQMIITLIED